MKKNRLSSWRLPLGARVTPKGVFFRVWAPDRKTVDVIVGDKAYPLHSRPNGYFEALIPHLKAGTLYEYSLDQKDNYPDPCSRYQPEGPHRPSLVIDPDAFCWTDHAWKGLQMPGQVFYEMHVGTFTSEGTFDAALQKLAYLEKLGITVIEVMPVNEWAGRWNWGYDGVNLYSPSHTYGDSESFKRFVNRAHTLGLGVILDVVYNHLGPDECYLDRFTKHYFNRRLKTEWGAALDFSSPHSFGVREFFVQNACYWISEFHLDGLRLDATQNIYDTSPTHILADLSQSARRAAGKKSIIITAENEPQQVQCLLPISEGGYGFDALWSDDFHHSSRVVLTNKHDAYYSDYRGMPQEFISVLKRNFLYQGQTSQWQRKFRGSPTEGHPASSFIFYLQNHDQIANSLEGKRVHQLTSPGRYRAITALWLLSPQAPFFFMGQEWSAKTPFLYFVDHKPELANRIRKGRHAFLSQFPDCASSEAQKKLADPSAEETFLHSKLQWDHQDLYGPYYKLHRDLLRIRRTDSVLSGKTRHSIDGAVLGPQQLVIRFFGSKGDRLLVLNWGQTRHQEPCAEPLLAPLRDSRWTLLWNSEESLYQGSGKKYPQMTITWDLPAESAWLYGTTY